MNSMEYEQDNDRGFHYPDGRCPRCWRYADYDDHECIECEKTINADECETNDGICDECRKEMEDERI